MGKGLRIVHLNIRSLAKNYDELFILFDDYDIILLSETWLNHSFDSGLIKRDGFVLYRQDRDKRIKKRGGGLAMSIKSEIALHASVRNEVSDVTRNLEQLWVHVREPGRKHFVISVMYRPPAGSIKLFLDEMKDSLKSVFENTSNWEHIIMGDFNVDFSHMEQVNCKKLNNLITNYGMKHHHTGSTRIAQNSHSTIDLMFSDIQNIMEVGVKSIVISDHLPTYIIRKKPRNIIEKEQVELRKMWNYSIENMEILIRTDKRWQHFWDENLSVDELWDIMYSIFVDSINMLCPIVKRIVQRHKPSWVNKEVNDAIAEKNRLYTIARGDKNSDDWDKFRIKKKSTRKLISQTKCTVTKNRLNENRGNPKNIWRQINKDILGKENSDGLKVIKDQFGNCLTGLDAANYINKIYADMGKETDQTTGNWVEGTMNMDHVGFEFDFKFIEMLEIHQ